MKISVFCGTSADGFLARTDDTFDFLKTGESVPHGFTEFLNSVDVVVMGRRTFEVVRKLGHFALYGKKHLVVLSSQPLDLSSIRANFERMSGTPQEIATQLEKRGFKHAYVDGGIPIQRFLRAGLVDRITVTRVPVLIGQGVPLFGPLAQDVHLRHLATRSFKGGLVQSQYGAQRRPASRGKPRSRTITRPDQKTAAKPRRTCRRTPLEIRRLVFARMVVMIRRIAVALVVVIAIAAFTHLAPFQPIQLKPR